MTRLSKKCVWIIVLTALAVATFIAIAWGSSGFKNMDPAMWFNYWGKGKPAVTRVVEPAAEQHAMALTSADTDNTLINDSDDASITFALSKLPTPHYEWREDGLHIWTDGLHFAGATLTVKYSCSGYYGSGANGAVLTVFTYTTSGTNKSEEFHVPFSGIRNYRYFTYHSDVRFVKDSTGISMCNDSFDNYLDSDVALCPVFYNDNFRGLSFNLSGTQLSFVNCGVFETDAPYPSSYGGNYYYQSGCRINITTSNGDLVEYSYENNPNGFVALSDNVYTIDLLKLPFINDVVDIVTVSVIPYLNYVEPMGSTNFNFGCSLSKFNFSISKLASPTGLNYSLGTLTWNEVIDSNGYGVFWTEGNTEKQAFVDTPSYTFDIEALGEGEHTVRVRALGNMAQTAVETGQTMSITAYNASNVVTQVVALTYNIDGDVVIKFVPYGSKLSDYIYDVNISGREFGGWFYDSGFSRKVEETDVLNGDITIYARLSDLKVTERPLTWWEQYMWYVLGPIIGIAALGIIAGVVVGIRKKKAA